MKGGLGCSNFFANLGDTASQLAGPASNSDGSATFCETSSTRLGVFNVSLDPVYLSVIGHITMADIRDGASQTAMFSEIKRSQQASNSSAAPDDPSYVFVLPQADPAWDNNIWPGVCERWDPARSFLQISYRGLQYYRNLPATGYYTHTIVPNSRATIVRASEVGSVPIIRLVRSDQISFLDTSAHEAITPPVNVALCDGQCDL